MRRLLLVLSLAACAFGQAYRANSGFAANSLRNGDDNFAEVQLPFPVNFSGRVYSTTYISNNGNITFGTPNTSLDGRASWVPRSLRQITFPMIAPFYADVDTTTTAAVTYGPDRVNNRPAFGINWPGVGYFDRKSDKLNEFQLVLIDRSDTGTGNFDIEFNYSTINWDLGDDTVLGRAYASAGYTNGQGGDGGQFFELPGSLGEGSFLDQGPFALIRQSRNSGVAGRLVFEVRNGDVNATTLILQPERTTRECPEVTVFARGSGYRTAAFTTPNFTRSLIENGQTREITSFIFTAVPDAAPGTYDFTVRYRSVTPLNAAGALNPDSVVQLNVALPAVANLPAYTATDTKTIRNCALTAECGTLPTTALLGFQLTGRASATGGVPPYSFAGSNLPPGLALNSNGLLSGAATAPGAYSYTVTARDTSSPVQSASVTCRLAVTGQAVPLSGTCNTPGGAAGASYSGSISAAGGSGQYTFALTTGALPPGLTLAPSTGAITGTIGAAANGAYSFTVTIRDSAQASATVNCSITVAPIVIVLPTLSSFSPIAATVGGPAFTLTVTGANFTSASRFVWNSFELATTLLSPTRLTVVVPANLLSAAGAAQVLVRNAANSQSAPSAFNVFPPLGGLVLNPASLRATGQDTTVTMTGTGFWPNIAIQVDNATVSSRRISAEEVQFTVPGTALRAPGSLSIRAQNGNGQAASANLPVALAVNVTPTLSFDRPTVITDQNAVTIRLTEAPGTAIAGTLRITFAPNADNQPNNGNTDFPRFTANATRTIPVAIAANATEFRAVIDQGSVAGTATVTLDAFTAAGVELIPGARPTQTFAIDPTAPLILPGSVAMVRTATGFNVELLAISTVRNLSAGTVTFTLASGIQANSTLTFPIENLPAIGTTWFSSAAGRNAGGAFRITVPFTLEGEFTNLQGVSVTLSNARGASAAVSGARR